MALRRPLRPSLCLNRLSTITTHPHDTSSQSQPLRSSHFYHDVAIESPAPPTRKPAFADLSPPRQRTELGDLLRAVQRQDESRLYDAFIKWTKILADVDSPHHEDAKAQVRGLAPATLSEILRSLDPVRNARHDVARNLAISQGQTQFMDTGKIMDEYGVRSKSRKVLSGLQALISARSASDHALTPADHEVLMRCAGAAVDFQAVKTFWASMAANGQGDARTSQTWAEFIKARFVTEPLYYQYDRARVAVQARDKHSGHKPLFAPALRRMDNVRLSINALKREPWNRRQEEPDEDIRRLLRRRRGYRSYKGHWLRALYYGHQMDEELLCASMVAFARSSSLHAIKTLIFEPYYGITMRSDPDNPADTVISGGVDMPEDSPLRPTQRLLNAVVEALGCMSDIPLAMKLVDFLSRRYDVPVAHATWSNILNWTYLCASKPYQPMRKLAGNFASSSVSTANVRQVWDVMTSEPYCVAPTPDDYDVYIKTLIIQRALGRALAAIRAHGLPHYYAADAAYQRAVADDVLQNDVAPSPRATRRRQEAQLAKDHARLRITTWLHKLLKTASANRAHRDGPVMRVLVPDLVAEFADFLPAQVHYRTAQGVVRIDRPDAAPRFLWRRAERQTLPQKLGAHAVRAVDAADSPDFAWPTARPIKVVEWQRRPRRRAAKLGKPPKHAAEREWWDRLEEQMML